MTDNEKSLPYYEGTADDLRRMIGRQAWAAQKTFGNVIDQAYKDGKTVVLEDAEAHLAAHRAAAYTWTTVSLLGFIKAKLGDDAMHEAAAMVDDMLTNGDAPYAEDITDPEAVAA